jgi:hypothetical protein
MTTLVPNPDDVEPEGEPTEVPEGEPEPVRREVGRGVPEDANAEPVEPEGEPTDDAEGEGTEDEPEAPEDELDEDASER